MPEISLRGEKYTGVFNGDKREFYHREWYDGVAFIRKSNSKSRVNGKKYYFKFLIPEEFFRSSLKKSLESRCAHFDGFDPFCKLILFQIRESVKNIPNIRLEKTITRF